VADLPLDALLVRAEQLARAWAVALIGATPMSRMGRIPLEELAHEAPTLCTQMLRAVQSDIELERLTGEGPATGREASAAARTLSAVSGADDAESTVAAVEALRGVLWEAMLEELRAPAARLVADVADRLGYVCSRALAVSIATVQSETRDASVADETRSAAPDLGDTRRRGGEIAERLDAVIVDEHANARGVVRGKPAAPSPSTPLSSESPSPRPLAWDASPPVVPPPSRLKLADESPRTWDGAAPERREIEHDEIEIRDQRRDGGPSAWIGSIGRQLARFEHDGLPFSVLLVELLDADGVRQGEEPSVELAELSDRVRLALEGELGTLGSGSLTCEGPGRYWLLAPATDRAAAERLAERLAQAVSASVNHRHAPVEVAVGTAVCPDDGLQAPMLAAHADVGLYAARSTARAMSGRVAGS
jgi:hypothetical protein